MDKRDVFCTASLSTTLTVYRPVTFTDSEGRTWVYEEPYVNTTEVSSGWKAVSPLTVFWQSTDLSRFDAAYASALASKLQVKLEVTQTSPMAVTMLPTASPASTYAVSAPTGTDFGSDMESESTSTSGLSPGVKVGISIGSVCGVAILAAAMFLLHRYFRRRKITDCNEEETEAGIHVPELLNVSEQYTKREVRTHAR